MSRGQRTLSSASSRRFRLEPISHVAEKFQSCGDNRKGIARIQCLNPSCRLDQRLFTAGSPITTAAVIAFKPFGDFLRANAHWHALVLEGNFAPDGGFLFLPIHDT